MERNEMKEKVKNMTIEELLNFAKELNPEVYFLKEKIKKKYLELDNNDLNDI